MLKILKILALFLMFISSVSSASLSSQIDSIRTKLAKARKHIEKLSSRENDLSSQINEMDRKISLLNQLVDVLKKKADSLGLSISVLSDSAKVQQLQWQSHQKELEQVLRQMYVSGKIPQWELFFIADDMGSLGEALVYFGAIAEARNKKIASAKSSYERYSRTVKILQAQRDSLTNILAEKRSAKDSLDRAFVEQSEKLKKIRRNKREYENLISRLNSSLRKLEELLAEERAKGGKFSKMKGHLPCPLGGKCRIATSFGTVQNEKYGTYFSNPGVDILSEPGEKVFSVADGKVVNVIWLEGYRNVVIVSHDGGYYTIYGNLGKISVSAGEKIRAGQEIGTVAKNSWLQYSSTLHFEVRHGKNRENPAEWLTNSI
ncbi:peptidoglycan DD-metalloendopeptidase family protein [bacterium]|nr:peptidoglycan DD-metalloendopeptidase family protein [bacterium]